MSEEDNAVDQGEDLDFDSTLDKIFRSARLDDCLFDE